MIEKKYHSQFANRGRLTYVFCAEQRAKMTWQLSEEVSCFLPVCKFLLLTTGSLGMICTKRVHGNGYQEPLFLMRALSPAVLYQRTTNTIACNCKTANNTRPLLRTAQKRLLQSVSTIHSE